VFQASEGGSVSVGRRKFQSNPGTKAGATPAPQSKLGAAARPMRGYGTDRISRIAGMTSIASPAASSREVVLSKTSLAGICLITFACGIVTTVVVDRRGGDQVTAREPDPSLTRAAAEPAPIAPPPIAPPTVAPAPAAPTSVAPGVAAAADPLVVQMPNLDEASKSRAIRAVPVVPLHPRAAETPLVAAQVKPPAAVAPAPVAIKAKPAAQAVVAPVAVRVKAKPAMVAAVTPTPARTRTAVMAPVKAKPAFSASSMPARSKAAASKASSPKATSSAKAPSGPKGTSSTKKAKPATEGSDPANGWVDPFAL
jgi:hypothetical protein